MKIHIYSYSYSSAHECILCIYILYYNNTGIMYFIFCILCIFPLLFFFSSSLNRRLQVAYSHAHA